MNINEDFQSNSEINANDAMDSSMGGTKQLQKLILDNLTQLNYYYYYGKSRKQHRSSQIR